MILTANIEAFEIIWDATDEYIFVRRAPDDLVGE